MPRGSAPTSCFGKRRPTPPPHSRNKEPPLSALFSPLELGSLRLANRIVIAPMCQYSAEDGCMSDWHTIHLGHLALSGAALLTIEATAVTPEGRISYGDTGLWSDANEEAMARVFASVRRWSDMPIAIQLGHAGRKASTDKPWFGGAQIAPDAENGWQTVAPSPVPFLEGENAPEELDQAGLDRIRQAFADAAERSARLGLAAVQLHGAQATSSTSSSRRSRTSGPTNMAAASRTACASRSRCSMRSARSTPLRNLSP